MGTKTLIGYLNNLYSVSTDYVQTTYTQLSINICTESPDLGTICLTMLNLITCINYLAKRDESYTKR